MNANLTNAECVEAVRHYLDGGVDRLAAEAGIPFAEVFERAERAARDFPNATRVLHLAQQGRHDMTSRAVAATLAGRRFPDPPWSL